MYSSQGRRGPPKSTPTSLLRHYSYECKVAPQDRPYKARPSRSQQLRNPKLAPKLHEDTFNPLQLKEGVADEELAKREAERAKKRKLDNDSESDSDDVAGRRGAKPTRSRTRRSASYSDSGSNSGSNSGSTSSASPPRAVRPAGAEPLATTSGGRDRSISSASRSASSFSSDGDRSPRRKRSPSAKSDSGDDHTSRPQRRGSPPPPARRASPHQRKIKPHDDRMKSSDFFGGTDAAGEGSSERRWHRDDSVSPVRDEGHRRQYKQRGNGRGGGHGGGRNNRDGDRGDRQRQPPTDKERGGREERDDRQRSLSPFSRRLALTREMKSGR